MINFSVDKEDLVNALKNALRVNALKNALRDIEINANADISKILLKLYITEGAEYDGSIHVAETVCVSTILFNNNCCVPPKEKAKIYNICVYKANKDGQESYDYSQTYTFEDTILLSKEAIEKILEFLNESPSTVKTAEILHSKYVNKSYIKCNDKIIRV